MPRAKRCGGVYGEVAIRAPQVLGRLAAGSCQSPAVITRDPPAIAKQNARPADGLDDVAQWAIAMMLAGLCVKIALAKI